MSTKCYLTMYVHLAFLFARQSKYTCFKGTPTVATENVTYLFSRSKKQCDCKFAKAQVNLLIGNIDVVIKGRSQ